MNKASLIYSGSERASDLQQVGIAHLGIDAHGLQSDMPQIDFSSLRAVVAQSELFLNGIKEALRLCSGHRLKRFRHRFQIHLVARLTYHVYG